MLKHKEEYLKFKNDYTISAGDRYRLWLDKFETLIAKTEGEVTRDDISQYRHWLQLNHAEKSVEYAMTVLHNYFSFLRLNDLQCLKPELIKAPKARANSYQATSPEDYKKILSAVDKIIPQNHLRNLQAKIMIRILSETGVRVSELTGIQIDSINLKKSGALIKNKKNLQVRWIYWSEETNLLIEQYLPVREQLNRSTRALFLNSTKQRGAISRRSVERLVKACCKIAEVRNVVPHSFRHGMAHNILEKGGNVADVQKVLGHRSPISSMKYLQYTDKEHERRIKNFLMA